MIPNSFMTTKPEANTEAAVSVDVAQLANSMRNTLYGVYVIACILEAIRLLMRSGSETVLQTFNAQSTAFNKNAIPNMDKSLEIQDLEKRIFGHERKRSRFINDGKKIIRKDLKKTVSDLLRNDISFQIEKEVALQVKEQVGRQIHEHIPVPLQQQKADNAAQIQEIRVSLANSAARAKNSHLQPSNVDDPLANVLRSDGSKSRLFPADLRSLFSYDLDMARALVNDFDLEEDTSTVQVNFSRFMRHIGIENFGMLVTP